MKQTFYLFNALLAGLLVSACGNGEALTETHQTSASETALVTASAAMPQDADTKLQPEDKTNILSLTWEAKDVISVMRGADGTPVQFSQDSSTAPETKDGKSTTTFSGTVTVEKTNPPYYAVYPEVPTAVNAKSITLDMTGQTGALKGDKVYLYASSQLDNDYNLNFGFQHLTSILKLSVQVYPFTTTADASSDVTNVQTRTESPSKLTSISFAGKGLKPTATVDITATNGIVYDGDDNEITLAPEGGFTLSNGKITDYIFLHFLPDKEIGEITVKATDEKGNIYFGTITRDASSALAVGTMYTKQVELTKSILGYVMLADGSLVPPSEYNYDENAADDKKAIGVVAYQFIGEAGRNIDAITKKLTYAPTGLVMALGMISTPDGSGSWGETIGAAYYTNLKAAYEGYNGYYLTNQTEAVKEYGFHFAASHYEQLNSTPQNTTGWYVPSIGEWIDILGFKGIGGIAKVDALKHSAESSLTLHDYAGKVISNYNNAFTSAVGEDFSKWPSSLDQYYQYLYSTTEYNSDNIYVITIVS